MRRSVVVIAIGVLAVAAMVIFGLRSTRVASTLETSATKQSIAAPAVPDRVADDRVAVASIAAPRSAIDRYQSDDRLFDLFERLRHSPHGADLWVASRIAFDCRFTLREDAMIAAALAGRSFNHFEKTGAAGDEAGALDVTQAIATPAQVDAARELRRRCTGFESMSLATYRSPRADIEDRLRHLDDPVGLASAIADHRMPATPDRLKSVLASRDHIAITLLDAELGERWHRYSGQPLAQAPFGPATPVMQLVACDLEWDCSPSSRSALFGCIDDADGCGLDVHRQLMRRETPPTQQRIEDTRAAYLHAIVSGDYGIWGL